MRWLFFLLALGFLIKNIFFDATPVSLTGFVACAGLWYWLARRKALGLDGLGRR